MSPMADVAGWVASIVVAGGAAYIAAAVVVGVLAILLWVVRWLLR